ncbi:MAG: dUTP diphosphatase [Lentisphaeria bacterium]|nr:dUTP diphosphatase [Lentisphaeria bacterium]
MRVKIQLLPDCEELMPRKAHADDAAFDLRSRIDIDLPVRRSVLVPAGFCMELPPGFEAQIRPRSGLALKHDIMLTNSPGTIDAGYRGEVGIIVYNGGSEPFPVKRGDRIAQMVIAQLPEVELAAAGELNVSDRGEGGFGSTGVTEKL